MSIVMIIENKKVYVYIYIHVRIYLIYCCRGNTTPRLVGERSAVNTSASQYASQSCRGSQFALRHVYANAPEDRNTLYLTLSLARARKIANRPETKKIIINADLLF